MKGLGYLCALVVGFAVGYVVGKSKEAPIVLSSSGVTGIGAGGTSRLGAPKTMAERLATHQRIYGTSELPPRGTGLTK